MFRQPQRIRINTIGGIEIVDPSLDALPVLQAIDPGFQIRTAALEGFVKPRALTAIRFPTEVSGAELAMLGDNDLCQAHDRALQQLRSEKDPGMTAQGGASLLDLKRAMARRLLRRCVLCAHRCGVDREAGQMGRCGLGVDATVAKAFVHIAEEAPVNPSLIISLAGCGLRCRFCQQSSLLKPSRVRGGALNAGLWRQLDFKGARSLSFVGGNPDESLPRVLDFLSGTPSDFRLPVVWNSHGYQTAEALHILDGVIDAYIPDFKYGNDSCATALAKAPGYLDAAREAIRLMLEQEVPVIVRILVLPGHHECCHVPALDSLREMHRPQLLVSVRGQYCPDWRISAKDGPLARRTSVEETEQIRGDAKARGLTLVEATSATAVKVRPNVQGADLTCPTNPIATETFLP